MNQSKSTTKLLITWAFALLATSGHLATHSCAAAPDATLPPDVKAVWDLGKAFHEKTATRERIPA